MNTIKQNAGLASVAKQKGDMLTEVPVVNNSTFLQEVIGEGIPEQMLTERKKKIDSLDNFYGHEPTHFTD